MKTGLVVMLALGVASACAQPLNGAAGQQPQVVGASAPGRSADDNLAQREQQMQAFTGNLRQGTDKGAAEEWVFTVQNPGPGTVTAHFSSGMAADLTLEDSAGNLLWAWSQEMMFTQALRSEPISGGRELVYRFDVPRSALAHCSGDCVLTGLYAGKSANGMALLQPVSTRR